jgi:hypothetical protein
MQRLPFLFYELASRHTEHKLQHRDGRTSRLFEIKGLINCVDLLAHNIS